MRNARFVEPVRLELHAEVAYYNSKQPELGARFLTSVQAAIACALYYPLTGSRSTRNARRAFIKDFPFAIVYRPDEEGLVIFAIAHLSRRPGYWRSRTNGRQPSRSPEPSPKAAEWRSRRVGKRRSPA